MSLGFVDDLKELVGLTSAKLDSRLHAVELQLGGIARSSDFAARQVDFETLTRRYTFKGAVNPATFELLTVPQGSYYRLNQWTWVSGEEVKVGLYLDGIGTLLDAAAAKAKTGREKNSNLVIIPEGQTLWASCIEGGNEANEVTLVLQFTVYEKQAHYQTITGEGE